MLTKALKMIAEEMSGPPAAVERNPASFGGSCFYCGLAITDPIEGSADKQTTCPRCGANLEQPYMINTAPDEEFLSNPRAIASKESK